MGASSKGSAQPAGTSARRAHAPERRPNSSGTATRHAPASKQGKPRAQSGGSRSASPRSTGTRPASSQRPRSKSGARRGSPYKRTITRRAVIAAIIAVLVVFGAADFFINRGVVHRGVTVAGIDVGGMSQADAATAISDELSQRMSQGAVTIYASDSAKTKVSDTPVSQASSTSSSESESGDASAVVTETAAVDEDDPQLSYWSVTPQAIGASADAEALAEQAYSVGRGADFLPGRMKAIFGGVEVPVELSFDETLVAQVEGIVNAAIGTPAVDGGIQMVDGVAQTTPASDGWLVDDSAFRSGFSDAVVSESRAVVAPMATAHYTIDDSEAASVAQTVNGAVSKPIRIVYGGTYWTLDQEKLAECVATKIDDGKLVAYADIDKSKAVITALLGEAIGTPAKNAEFVVSDGAISISPSTDGSGPDVAQGALEVEQLLFEDGNGSTDRSITLGEVSVSADTTTEYLESLGVTDLISTYTMQYWGSDAHNHNICTLAKLLNGHLVAPGSDWDFNETIGECNESNGFQAAGAIVDGVYTDEIGGGICFVVTDLFNAVLEAGMPVVERHNHSLYIASYPDGRDATVSYPDPDFVFSNSTDSWMLIHTEYDDNTVTVQLWGTSPGYDVTFDKSDWVPGEAYTTIRMDDPTLPKGTEQKTTEGVNGHSVTVYRHIAKNGQPVSEDSFTSVYNPQTEVIKVGTG